MAREQQANDVSRELQKDSQTNTYDLIVLSGDRQPELDSIRRSPKIATLLTSCNLDHPEAVRTVQLQKRDGKSLPSTSMAVQSSSFMKHPAICSNYPNIVKGLRPFHKKHGPRTNTLGGGFRDTRKSHVPPPAFSSFFKHQSSMSKQQLQAQRTNVLPPNANCSKLNM